MMIRIPAPRGFVVLGLITWALLAVACSDGGVDPGAADTGTTGLDSSVNPDAPTTDGAAADGVTVDGATTDGMPLADASGDGGTGTDGGPTGCTPILPLDGTRMPTSDRTELTGTADFAVHPCTGDIGFAWSESTGRGTNSEIWFRILPQDGSSLGTAQRITTAPGPSFLPRVVWSQDRFAVVWADQRHDALPDTCTAGCRQEFYYAAFDASGSSLVGELRLTYKTGSVLSPRWVTGPPDGEMALIWVDHRMGTEIYMALVRPDGIARFEQQVNVPATGTEAHAPSTVWNETDWTIIYSDRVTGDQVFVRTMATDGTLSAERGLFAGSRPEMGRRSDGSYAVLAIGPRATLRFADSSMMVGSTVRIPEASHYDGTWRLRWMGGRLWVTTSVGGVYGLLELNPLGVLLGTHPVAASMLPAFRNVDLQVVDDRQLLLEYGGAGEGHRLVIVTP